MSRGTLKKFHVSDYNLNVHDYESNNKLKTFFNLIFQHGLIPVINKPTRVTKKSVTTIDHTVTNAFLKFDISTGIIKTDNTVHFPIFLIARETNIDLTVLIKLFTKDI